MIDCSIEEKDPIKLKYAIELFQSLQAKIWSTSPYVARQVEGIGPQHAKTLAQANLINMEQLRNCDPGRIEVVSRKL
jgi:ATP-dependent DNA helicase HFM1/MER3